MTPALIRAARALLDWQQQDLAITARLSLSAVNKFERGIGVTRPVTLQAMVTALKGAGIEFPNGGGVRHSTEVTSIQRISGNDCLQKLNEDIFASVTRPDQEIYSCSALESQWFVPGFKDIAEHYYQWRSKLGVRQLYIVPKDNTVFESPKSHYRLLPPPMIGKIAFILYADRVAFVMWRKKQIFILRGTEVALPFREQFKFLWRLGIKAA